MKIVKEFKEFAVKGNVVDMAVGIIIGAAFTSVVKSLVDDIIMPPIGKLTGGVDFSNLFISLGGEYESLSAAKEAGAVTLNYGLFLNNVISFLIVAWVVFLLVKAVNNLKRKEEAKPSKETGKKQCPACKLDNHKDATRCAYCTSEIKKNS